MANINTDKVNFEFELTRSESCDLLIAVNANEREYLRLADENKAYYNLHSFFTARAKSLHGIGNMLHYIIFNEERNAKMNEPRKPITDFFLITDTMGNVVLLDYEGWRDWFTLNANHVKAYARELNLKQMDQVIQDYRKGKIKFGDEK